jgi:hypothetical protein
MAISIWNEAFNAAGNTFSKNKRGCIICHSIQQVKKFINQRKNIKINISIFLNLVKGGFLGFCVKR